MKIDSIRGIKGKKRSTLAKRWRACSISMETEIKMKQTEATAQVGVVSSVAIVVSSSPAIFFLFPLVCNLNLGLLLLQ